MLASQVVQLMIWQVETLPPPPPLAALCVENVNDVNMFQDTTVGFYEPSELQVRTNDLYDTSCCCLH